MVERAQLPAVEVEELGPPLELALARVVVLASELVKLEREERVAYVRVEVHAAESASVNVKPSAWRVEVEARASLESLLEARSSRTTQPPVNVAGAGTCALADVEEEAAASCIAVGGKARVAIAVQRTEAEERPCRIVDAHSKGGVEATVASDADMHDTPVVDLGEDEIAALERHEVAQAACSAGSYCWRWRSPARRQRSLRPAPSAERRKRK